MMRVIARSATRTRSASTSTTTITTSSTPAQSLLTRAHYTGGAFSTTKIDEVPGQYAIEAITPLRDGAFVTRGTHQVRVYRQIAGTWHSDQIAGTARDVAVGSLHGNSNDDILVLGAPSEIVSIK